MTILTIFLVIPRHTQHTAGKMKPHLSARSLVMLKEFLAELVGTCVLLMFGCGCVAQSVLSGKADGGMLSINIGWGLGVLVGVLIAGPVSGKQRKYIVDPN